MPGLDCEAIGAIVVDLDAKENGVASFEALCLEHGIDIRDCPMVRTPTGGIHLFFADPQGRWRNTTSRLAPGVDTRGFGGYVVAAGASRRNFGLYEPVHPATLPELIDVTASRRLPRPLKPLADVLDACCLSRDFVPRTAVRQAPGTAQVDLGAAAPSHTVAMIGAGPFAESALLVDVPLSVNGDLSVGLSERWTLEGALAAVTTAVPGRRNDTFAREAFTAGLRSQALGLEEDKTIDALIDAAKAAGSDDAKTVDTITRCFSTGAAQAEREAAVLIASVGSATELAMAHPSPTAALSKAALKIAETKVRVKDAYRLGLAVSREKALERLAKFCATVTDPHVRQALAPSIAVLLSRDCWEFDRVRSTCAFLGLAPADTVRLAEWAARTARAPMREPA
jgi:hypothetical protein